MNESKKKVLQGLFLCMLCLCPLSIVVGCGADSCVRCTMCGDDDTRFFICAKGTDEKGVEYTSCVGPAGILGIGLNTKCWPTECVSISASDDGSSKLSGCIIYYNEAGCIAKSGVKSSGSYTDSVTCLGISCAGTRYEENIANTTQAYETSTCFGISCGERHNVTPNNYNNSMPRAFTHGCWTKE